MWAVRTSEETQIHRVGRIQSVSMDTARRSSFIMRRKYVVANKQTPWPLVRERTIPTERPPHVDEI
jgi:hypothetical protein